MLNCPPAPEDGDSHGHILIKTISERSCELVRWTDTLLPLPLYLHAHAHTHELTSSCAATVPFLLDVDEHTCIPCPQREARIVFSSFPPPGAKRSKAM